MRMITGGMMVGALLLGACGGGDDRVEEEPYESLATTADTSEGYATAEPAPVTAVQGGETVGGPLTATGNLATPGGSSIGSVTLRESEDATRVSVTVRGLAPGTEMQASLVSGRCASPGQVVGVMEGTGRMEEDGVAMWDGPLPVRTAALLDGQHAIRLTAPEHARDLRPGGAGMLACADLPADDSRR